MASGHWALATRPVVHLTTQGQQGGLARLGLGVALSGHGVAWAHHCLVSPAQGLEH